MPEEKSIQNNTPLSYSGLEFKASQAYDSSKYITYTFENGMTIKCLSTDPLFNVVKQNEKLEARIRQNLEMWQLREELARAENKEKSAALDSIKRELRLSGDLVSDEQLAQYHQAKNEYWSTRFSLTAAGNRVFSSLASLRDLAFDSMKNINAMTFNYMLNKSLG